MPQQAGGGHLPPGHAVNGIVNEDDSDFFATGGGMDNFGRANGGQIAISLVSKDNLAGIDPLDAGSHCWRTAVSGFAGINIKIVIGEY